MQQFELEKPASILPSNQTNNMPIVWKFANNFISKVGIEQEETSRLTILHIPHNHVDEIGYSEE